MRLRHWMTSIAALLAVAVGGTDARAEDYDPTRVVPAGAPNFNITGRPGGHGFEGAIPEGHYPLISNSGAMGAGPAVMGAGMTGPTPPGAYVNPGAIPGHSSLSNAPLPQEFQPWPQMSPFQNRFSQHYNDDGLWFHDFNNDSRRYFFTMDALLTKFRYPKERVIGSDRTDPQIVPNAAAAGTTSGTQTGNNPLDPINTTVLFAPTTTGEAFDNWDPALGTKVSFGFFDPDKSGFAMNGFWTGEMDDTQRFGIPGSVSRFTLVTRCQKPGAPTGRRGTAVGAEPKHGLRHERVHDIQTTSLGRGSPGHDDAVGQPEALESSHDLGSSLPGALRKALTGRVVTVVSTTPFRCRQAVTPIRTRFQNFARAAMAGCSESTTRATSWDPKSACGMTWVEKTSRWSVKPKSA